MTEKAWKLCDPDAENVFKALRKAGVKTAVVSNFDTRLRPLLHVLKCDHWFDAVAVSAEVAAEKPNPTIFLKACESLGVKPEEAVHVGDDRRMIYGELEMQAAMPGYGEVMFTLSRRLQRGSGLRWPSDGQWFSGALIDIYGLGVRS
nr:hydrolase, putative, expressed [Oryza sativa Japonica Group]BAG98396.1 unnamed protein product [Oryza sativa Japonica Group]